MNKKYIAGVVVLVFFVGVGAFFGGTVYEKNSLSVSGLLRSEAGNGGNFSQGMMTGRGQGQSEQGHRGQVQVGQQRQAGDQVGRMNRGGGFLAGEILSKDDKSITVKTPDGSSKIVYFSDTTSVSKSTQSFSSDLAVGSQVTVGGQSNADGSIAAQNIQIR